MRITSIVLTFILPDGLVVDCCVGILSVAKTCMLFPQHRWFVECVQDSECVALSLPYVALIFACQVLNMEPNIAEDGDVQQAASGFDEAMEELDLKLCIDVLGTLSTFPVLQMFSLRLLYHRSTQHI